MLLLPASEVIVDLTGIQSPEYVVVFGFVDNSVLVLLVLLIGSYTAYEPGFNLKDTPV
jgi:hypothetical protein